MSTPVTLMVIAIFIIGVILLAVIMFTKQPTRRLDQGKYRERWMNIMAELDQTAASQQLAILHADKLLDQALKERGVAGDTLGERMKTAKNSFSDRNGIWEAHKLRNHIAHDERVSLNMKKTRRALDSFKKALIDVGAL